MSLTVRFAREGDEETIASLLVDIHTLHAKGRPDLFGKGHTKFDAEAVRRMFHSDDQPFFVADDGEGVVGYAICKKIRNQNPVQGDYTTLYLDDLNVDERARRRGVGSALLDACRAYAKASGCYNLTLNVWAFNEGAIAFYQKNGFACQRMIMEELI